MKRNNPQHGRKSYGFIVEGECERIYISSIKTHFPTLKFNFNSKLSSNLSIEEQYHKVVNSTEVNDLVFWIIDLDAVINNSRGQKKSGKTPLSELQGYLEKIAKSPKLAKKVVTIINNPCFEFWLLLHFIHTTKSFSFCKDATKELKTQLPSYSKAKAYYLIDNPDIYRRLQKHLPTALKNARLTGSFDPDQPHKGLSEMYKLFDALGITGEEE